MAKRRVGNLYVDMTLNSGQFNEGLKKSTRNTKTFKQTMEQAANTVQFFTKAIAGIAIFEGVVKAARSAMALFRGDTETALQALRELPIIGGTLGAVFDIFTKDAEKAREATQKVAQELERLKKLRIEASNTIFDELRDVRLKLTDSPFERERIEIRQEFEDRKRKVEDQIKNLPQFNVGRTAAREVLEGLEKLEQRRLADVDKREQDSRPKLFSGVTDLVRNIPRAVYTASDQLLVTSRKVRQDTLRLFHGLKRDTVKKEIPAFTGDAFRDLQGFASGIGQQVGFAALKNPLLVETEKQTKIEEQQLVHLARIAGNVGIGLVP